MKKLIECVPNFSEGRDMGIIKQITDAIESVEGIKLLDVDPGMATNRTVVTFCGEPEQVVEAAFRGMKKAAELIDMSKHKGEHPRFGATDVCPLVPLSNISMEETVEWARVLAKRAGEELGYPIYCYESACFVSERKNLAYVREGEYEGLEAKLAQDKHKPDFGPAKFVARTGATAVGARDFLIAVNFNLNTTSVRRANSIAFDVREAGRVLRDGDPIVGKIKTDASGEPLRQPGTCKGTKAIGWYIDEYGIAQVSMNITDITATPLHIAFEEICKSAEKRGLRVSGTEIVGLVPKKVLMAAGRYFLKKQQRSVGVSEEEIIKIAIKSMGLDDLKPFDPQTKVIENLLSDPKKEAPLVHLSAKLFAETTASEAPAPGGGSVSAYLGALGAALGTMVANLSSHKAGWDARWEEFSREAEIGYATMNELLYLVDEDTKAFNKIMSAFGLPKETEEEKNARKAAIQDATKYAIEVPLRTMRVCNSVFPLLRNMIDKGNPNSITDAAVGVLSTRAAIRGAFLNVKINVQSCKDAAFVEKVMLEANEIDQNSDLIEKELIALTSKKMGI